MNTVGFAHAVFAAIILCHLWKDLFDMFRFFTHSLSLSFCSLFRSISRSLGLLSAALRSISELRWRREGEARGALEAEVRLLQHQVQQMAQQQQQQQHARK
jgi:hypothetical protein